MHNQVKQQHESAPGRALAARSMPEDELRAAARDGSNADAGRGGDRELGDGDASLDDERVQQLLLSAVTYRRVEGDAEKQDERQGDGRTAGT